MGDPRHRLTRSSDALILGVCAGIAEFLGWSVAGVRALYGIVTFLTGFVPGLLVYMVLALMMPPSDGDPSGFDLEDYREQ